MSSNEILRFVGKNVEIQLKYNKKVYSGLLKYDVYTFYFRKRTKYKLIDKNNNIILVFRPSHIKSIREI
jgi:hypothetical protein